jgi:carbamoyltransferase
MNRPFYILGINYGGHDTSAALMKDGNLIAAGEQERYTLDKHSRLFPSDAINDCLSRADLEIQDIDEIAYAFQPIYHIREVYLRPGLVDESRIAALISDIDRIKNVFEIESLVRENTGFSGQINFYNHHECHLASAWYPSGFTEALVASYDGIGEVETGMLAVGKGASLEVFHRQNRYPDSLGLIYSALTHFLGWRHHCDEGIIMGLACYGDPHAQIDGDKRTYIDVFREIIQQTGDYSFEINKQWIAYHKVRDKWVSDEFFAIFGNKRAFDDDLSSHHKNIAAALQLRLEEVVLGQLYSVQKSLSLDKLCLSGGVALNCSMNGKIQASRIFDEIFVQPASGDSGVAVGACYQAHKARCPESVPQKMHNFYLGSIFRDQEIEAAFLERDLVANTPENLFELVAKRLAEGKIVGWFQNGAEFGPRALGNRSILTRPFPGEMKDYLNQRVKFREEFRPFAPVVLAEYASEYFDLNQESPHMLIACQATEKGRQEIPATVHVDGSCRVQTVRPHNNEKLYKLLSCFRQETGCPVLLNTSFNVKGQPIVNTPTQAIDCFLATNIDCLVIGKFLVEKGKP